MLDVSNEKRKQETKENLINQRIVSFKKDEIRNKGRKIPNSLETTYYQLKEEEMKYVGLARKLGLRYSETKINDKDIHSSINLIRDNIQRIINKVQKVNDVEKLNKVKGVFLELEGLTLKENITIEHGEMLKENFTKSFDIKVQNLIKKSKISKLEMEREQIESEKISIIGRIFGKESLKQAKLDNIDIKKQLLMFEEEEEKCEYSLEGSLSELYAYSQYELGSKHAPEIQGFLKVVKSDAQLKPMIDEQKLKQKIENKVSERKGKGQLVPVEKSKLSNRQQANMIQNQNSEMNRQLQNSRIKKLTKQNSISVIKMENTSTLLKFYDIVNEIRLSTNIKDNNEQRSE